MKTNTHKLKLALGAALLATAIVVQPADADHTATPACDEIRVGMILPPTHRPIYEDEVPRTAFVNVNRSRYPEQLILIAFELNEDGDVELTYSGTHCPS